MPYGSFAFAATMTLACACNGSTTSGPPPRASEVPAGPVGAGPEDDDSAEASNEPGTEGDDDERGIAQLMAHAADAPRGAQAFLDEVNRVLTSVRSSTYSHHTDVNEAEGRYDLDCSGLIDYTLARSVPQALEQLRAATVKRPLAKHFVAFFRALPQGPRMGHWRPVTRALDLVPGDVVSWLKPADVSVVTRPKGARARDHDRHGAH